MKVLSLFSGCGGADLALEAAGYEIVALCEIEPHARAVLREHWPHTPLLGDVSLVDGTQWRDVDVVVGGSPCQDLSVAGKRAGLTEGSGTRSSLFFQQHRIWMETGAPYLIWENVFGALSSNNGADFAAVLSAIVGATIPVPRDGWKRGGVASGRDAVAAWRVLDLQHFGVPQRRERVVVLASRAGGVDPAEVLALGEGVRGDSAPRYEARERAAHLASSGVGARGGQVVPPPIASTLTHQYAEQSGQDDGMALVATRATPSPTASPPAKGRDRTPSAKSARPSSSGGGFNEEVYPTIRSNPRNNSDATAEAAMTVIQPVAHTLRGEGCDASEDGTGRGTPMVVAPCLRVGGRDQGAGDSHDNTPIVTQSIAENQRGELRLSDVSSQVTVGGGKPGQGYPAVVDGLGVRMLTPLECERIMGWPDDWTRYGVNEKGVHYELKDTPRYRLCGNGIGREWMEWIALRLKSAVEPQRAERAA